tara:strand:+ start:35897 stop:36682 length:786 start_codon:yes stop_codon:yes gene_type:complete
MNRWMFYIPLAYFFGTRVVTAKARISWCMIYPVPLLLIVFAFGQGFDLEDLVQLILASVCTYTIYELGYIQNDTVTIRSEAQPNLRLGELELEYVSDYWLVMLLVRLMIAGLLLSSLYSAPGFLLYLLSLLILGTVFQIYNRQRGPMNALLHPVLVTARFCGPLMLLLPDLTVFCYGLLVFPVLNGLERAREPRYGLTRLERIWFANSGSGRWGYYLVVLAAWLLLCVTLDLSLLTGLPLFYMFVYRLGSPWILTRLGLGR